MKNYLISVVLLAVAKASQECLYCKRADSRAGFLYSYSYCSIPALGVETCQEDSWNIVQTRLNCPSEYKQGWTLDIFEDCEAEEETGTCGEFISLKEFDGVYTNTTRTLKDNSMCTVLVDATDYVGRVIFYNDPDLGVLEPDYVIGQPITVP